MLQDFFSKATLGIFFSTIEVLLPSQLHRSFDNTTTVEGVRLLFFLPKKKMQKVNYSCDPYLFLSNENRDKSIERVVLLPQCGFFRIFLLLRFYVKSNLVEVEPQNLPFSHILRLMILIFKKFLEGK